MIRKQQPPVYSAINPDAPTQASQEYPAGAASNVVNILPPANVGQQYRDQCKSLPSY